LFYSAGRRGAQNLTMVVAKVSQKKTEREKEKKNHNPRAINLIPKTRTGYWFSQTAARCFPIIFFMIMISERGESGDARRTSLNLAWHIFRIGSSLTAKSKSEVCPLFDFLL
jgi:hypothetical protein